MKTFSTFNENRNIAQTSFNSYMSGDIDLNQLMRDTDGYEIATVDELEKSLKNKALLHMTADDHDVDVSDIVKRIKALLKELS